MAPDPIRPSAAAVALDSSAWGSVAHDSWGDSGWRSLIVREMVSRVVVDEVEVAPVTDQVITVVTSGGKRIESRTGRHPRSATYVPGTVGLTAPGRSGRFGWRCTGDRRQHALHLHLPGRLITNTAEQLWGREDVERRMPDALAGRDPVLEQTVLALDRASRNGADDLYAESAAAFLAAHLMTTYAGFAVLPAAGREDARVRVAIAYMHANLAGDVALADLAAAAHLSVFHFARVFRAETGVPPREYLTRLRVDAARRELIAPIRRSPRSRRVPGSPPPRG